MGEKVVSRRTVALVFAVFGIALILGGFWFANWMQNKLYTQAFQNEFGFYPTEDVRRPPDVLKIAERLDALCWAYRGTKSNTEIFQRVMGDDTHEAYGRVLQEELEWARQRFINARGLAQWWGGPLPENPECEEIED